MRVRLKLEFCLGLFFRWIGGKVWGCGNFCVGVLPSCFMVSFFFSIGFMNTSRFFRFFSNLEVIQLSDC